ncbi:MAG: flagellar hook-associated protein FlgK [Actinomycetota bacterium]|nr:flagellar hook-associated protein FlgK [Actinomycetota bacterium]
MSSFASLNTALTGLRAQRRGLDITGQNIANANTEGYSRQRVVQESVGGPPVPAFHSRYDGPGGGVTVTDVARLRDGFLEQRGQTEHGKQGFLTERADILRRVEDAFGEPGETGLEAQLTQMWNGWHDVAIRPGDSAARSQLIQRAGTVTDTLHRVYNTFDTQWGGTRDQLMTVADELNTTAATVAQLNEAIGRSTQAGEPVNELADKRDLLVMKLADLVGATTRPGEDGTVDVYVGGTALVRGNAAERLLVKGPDAFDGASTAGTSLVWEGDSFPALVQGGQAAAHLDALNNVLPGYAARLDEFTGKLVATVNAVHGGGYTADGSAGGAFFVGTTAKDVRVAVTDPKDVAASRYGGGAVDGGVADKIAQIKKQVDGPDAFYRQAIVGLGVESATASNRARIQADVTTQVDAARDSQAGVDLDEEMVNMLSYQRAYEGAARVMTAIDQVLDKLINSTGVVGR